MPARSLAPAPPADVRPWTLDRTLTEIRQRRLILIETTRGLRVRHRHRHRIPGLDDALAAYAGPLRVWLRLGGPEANVPAPWKAPDWDEATRLFSAWFGLRFAMPAEPVSLHPGETVRDWVRFRTSVIQRLLAGPEAPTAARLRADLATLFARFSYQETLPVRRTLPLAA